MLLNQLDYMGNKYPKCPHCGENFPVWDNDHPLGLNYQDGGQTAFECESCGKEFICVTDIIYMFSTATTEERADDSEWGPPDPNEIPETDDGSEAVAGPPTSQPRTAP